MAPGTPVNVRVAIQRIELLLYQRRFAAARAMAEEQAGIFITGPAAIDMTFERAKVERLAGKPREARVLTRAAINLVNQADQDIDPGDRMGLAVAYARLGEEKAAMREFATATTDKIGRAHVRTPVTNAHLVCRLLIDKKRRQ